ncbi:MAG: hypothetical protein LQ338_007551 [Usnochroma carphineum]|nr:MAG: hypothetical protein LQ338_007551 [Usnochroma carphineum]
MVLVQTETGYPQKVASSRSQGSLRRKADAMPLTTHHVNGNTRPPSDPAQREFGEKLSRHGTPSSTKAPSNYDSSYLSPPKGSKFRPALTSNGSRSGSEADSLLDLYGQPRSVVEGTEKSERDVRLEDLYNLEQEDDESSRWIHRDKLAVIETHEMQEAGITLPRQRRSKSSLRHKRSHSRNQSTASAKDDEPAVPGTREGKRQKVRSPVRREAHDDPVDYDPRTSGEIAAGPLPGSGSSAMFHHPNMGRSGSKIPVPKTSPLPIAQGHIERNAPLPRSRGVSGNWSGGDDDSFGYNKSRNRSNSIGGRVLLDDPEVNGTPTPAARPDSRNGVINSPPKQRSFSKPRSVSNARPRTSNGARNISEPQKLRSSPSTQRSSPGFPRPRSRNGLEPRPATAVNRPEGEAPWIAEMYKPDPRLPPEEQMLPTHAKRLQQEQREREAKEAAQHPQHPAPATLNPERPVGITRTPSPMAANNHTQPFNQTRNQQPYQNQNQNQNQDQDTRNDRYPSEQRPNANSPSSGQWPLKVAPPIKPPSAKSHSHSHNHNSTTNGNSPISPDQPHAGYSTIPKVQSTPTVGSAPSPKPMPQAMVQEKPRGRGREKEKGCGGCCVVM